ncbi:FAD-dependent oxidoreductase [Lentzea alba]|uniref:flavin monoamine oxidase family protein n=1 Tax=Lentzea alba TaxID=2714351 RepID=UPI0039BF48A8
MSPRKKVTVLGAGMAGLAAAYELEQLGHQVEVIEASERLGGRVYTHRFGAGPDAPLVELGAMRIPANHRHTLDYIEKLGLSHKLREFKTLFSDDGAYHRTRTGFVRVREAAEVLVADYQELMGDDLKDETVLFGAWITAIGDAIAPGSFMAELRPDFAALLDAVDRIDITPFLVGEARDQIDLHAFFAAHPEVRNSGTGRINHFIGDILDETSAGLRRLEGGMDQIVTALAEQINGPIRTSHEVRGIAVHDDHVAVTVSNGQTQVLHCDQVLSTIPFSVLRRLELSGFSDDKLAVLGEVTHWPATKIGFLCRDAFWERDGINGGASYGGGHIRQTYYPAVEGDPARGAALLASYTIGADAAVLDDLPEEERHALVLDEVAGMHPELLEPGMFVEAVSLPWGKYPWSAGAGVLRWNKDEAACLEERDRAARPERGRLFFAGEPCATVTGWIDGAIESAQRAVRFIEESSR